MYKIEEIGIVKNEFNQAADHNEMRKHESKIVIHKKYADGLFRIGEKRYLQVFFYFNQSEGYNLVNTVYSGEKKGVFASRSPRRPSMIGMSTVELLEIKENILHVKGLDAINGTPVFDIKPFERIFDTDQLQELDKTDLIHSPRKEINILVKREESEKILLKAGEFHGHYCPGLALGVLAGMYCSKLLTERQSSVQNDGMEKLLAIIEVNSCFADGIQYSTGCTFGNNSLIYRDLGKTAVSLVNRRNESDVDLAIRVCLKPGFRERLQKINPRFTELFEKVVKEKQHKKSYISEFKKVAMETSFNIIEMDYPELFTFQEIKPLLPDYAPIEESKICANCAESSMESRGSSADDNFICYTCGNQSYYQLDGGGISVNKQKNA